MIRLDPALKALGGAEQYGLEVLVDVSRLLPVDDPAADVVQAVVGPEGGGGRPDKLDAGLSDFEVSGGSVLVPPDLLRSVAAIAGGGIEQGTDLRDEYARVPSTANPLVASGRERWPLINTLGSSLRAAVLRARDRRPVRLLVPWPNGHRWAAAFTHDLDVVAWWPLAAALRLGSLIGRGHLRLAVRGSAAAAAAALRDPIQSGVQLLLDAEAEAGIPSTWFVICETPTLATILAGDVTYRPEMRRVRRILLDVGDAGHEIGLHGSFATVLSADCFASQRARLEQLIERPVSGVRQHFLRMRPGGTQDAMREAGFRYDATYGFADRNGFRLGVADIVPGWQARAGRRATLEEVPLVWMDRALSKYQGVESPDAWVDDAIALARTCQEAGGLWVGLWHPNLIPALGFPGGPRAFRRLLNVLLAEKPHVGTLGSLVAWRTRRRNARAASVAEDGRVSVSGVLLKGTQVMLEDENGGLHEVHVDPRG